MYTGAASQQNLIRMSNLMISDQLGGFLCWVISASTTKMSTWHVVYCMEPSSSAGAFRPESWPFRAQADSHGGLSMGAARCETGLNCHI